MLIKGKRKRKDSATRTEPAPSDAANSDSLGNKVGIASPEASSNVFFLHREGKISWFLKAKSIYGPVTIRHPIGHVAVWKLNGLMSRKRPRHLARMLPWILAAKTIASRPR